MCIRDRVNCYRDPAYKEIVSRLAADLKEYGEQYNDPRLKHPKIQQDVYKRQSHIMAVAVFQVI